jgi:hypothetical protein
MAGANRLNRSVLNLGPGVPLPGRAHFVPLDHPRARRQTATAAARRGFDVCQTISALPLSGGPLSRGEWPVALLSNLSRVAKPGPRAMGT